MTSSDRCDVIYPTTQLYNDTATYYNNKLTGLIFDGERAVYWKQAKTIGRFLSHQQDEVAGRGQEGGQ